MSKDEDQTQTQENTQQKKSDGASEAAESTPLPKEKGGPKGPEPTRYGDWEQKGKCVDF
ncbi:MAG: DUF1674 domain-containing protein [Alphaproteobacteria bacterium]|jgi:hypothetical protein|nr:DUF1674 domain-containing protein [Alphaproteobacteria bacterium]MDP7223106.1 DUF1674 domain-containing protein [Alphaproteobacteria bacterium]